MGSTKLVRWPRIVTGVVTLLFAGVIYAWSILKVPFEASWDAGQLGLNYTLTVCFFCIGGFISGLISKKTTSTLRLIISAVLLFLGFFIASRLEGGSVVSLYLSYGVLAGIGIGFVYNTVIGTVCAWYPEKKGLCSGILLMGFGLSSLIIGRIADIMGKSEAIGWRNTYVIIAISLAVVLLIAAPLVKPPPAGTVFPAPKAERKARQSREVRDYTALEMIKRPSFVLGFIYVAIIASAGSAAISFARDIILDIGATPGFAVTTVGMLAVFNGFGRLLSGWLFDRFGIKKTMYVVSSAAVAAPLIVVLALTLNSLVLGIAGVCLCGLSYGFAPTVCSAFASEFFGPKNFSLNFSIFTLILVPAPFAATLAGMIKNLTDGFSAAFIILTAVSVVGLFIGMCIKKA